MKNLVKIGLSDQERLILHAILSEAHSHVEYDVDSVIRAHALVSENLKQWHFTRLIDKVKRAL